MGTKKGQVRKTARRAYERKKKLTIAARFKRVMYGKNGRTKDEKLDDYNTISRLLYGRR
jgi:hypothetical protein